MAIHTGQPAVKARAAVNPAKAIVEPTDRSIPAVMMTRISPKALIAIQEKARITLNKLRLVRKLSVWRGRKSPITINTRKMPNSCAPKTWRKRVDQGTSFFS